MALTNEQITAQNFKDFYGQIRPYLNGTAHGGFTPIGTVISVMGKQAPHNYLVCDGTVYNIADYPELAAYFTGQFNASNFFGGDGVTTFAVPDLRGEFLRGTGTNSHTGNGNGANVGIHQDATSSVAMNLDTNNKLYTQGGGGTDVYATNVDTIKKGNTTGRTINSSALTWTGNGDISYTIRPTNTSVLYCIATKNIFMDAGSNYSTDEQVVGTWIDGKPIYQKTIDCGTLPNATSKTISMGSNIKRVINIHGCCYNSAGYNVMLPFLRVPVTQGVGNIAIMNVRPSLGTFDIITETDRSDYTESYVTLQYTKTTD